MFDSCFGQLAKRNTSKLTVRLTITSVNCQHHKAMAASLLAQLKDSIAPTFCNIPSVDIYTGQAASVLITM